MKDICWLFCLVFQAANSQLQEVTSDSKMSSYLCGQGIKLGGEGKACIWVQLCWKKGREMAARVNIGRKVVKSIAPRVLTISRIEIEPLWSASNCWKALAMTSSLRKAYALKSSKSICSDANKLLRMISLFPSEGRLCLDLKSSKSVTDSGREPVFSNAGEGLLLALPPTANLDLHHRK